MVHFVEIQNDVKRLGNLVARMGNAYVEVTHRTTTTEEIVVMNLYEMVLYVNVNASHVFDRNFSVTNTSDNCGDFFIFGSNGTLSLLKKDNSSIVFGSKTIVRRCKTRMIYSAGCQPSNLW